MVEINFRIPDIKRHCIEDCGTKTAMKEQFSKQNKPEYASQPVNHEGMPATSGMLGDISEEIVKFVINMKCLEILT
jgi:hypothetical protein